MVSICVSSFEQWRECARTLIQAQIEPSQIHWGAGDQASLFADRMCLSELAKKPAKEQVKLAVPKRFLQMARAAACFTEPQAPSVLKSGGNKWAILYSVLWRLVHQGRAALDDKADPQLRALSQMVKVVSRDCHKMKAFVRFKRVQKDGAHDVHDDDLEDPLYIAWFEPSHAIVERVAPFFRDRFTGMSWSILTPMGCMHWSRKEVSITPGIAKPPAVLDDYELLWKAYYCHIFNPARLKEKAMVAEMPKRYWQHLPEAECIQSLASQSSAQMQRMFSVEATPSDGLRAKSAGVRQYQDDLRRRNRW